MVLVAKPKRATPLHHKRRVGEHHKRNDHYLKPYWPYVPLALIVGIGLLFSSLWGNANKSVLGYASNMSVSALLQGTNTQRESNGLGDLSTNSQLNQAAQTKANDMATRDYWAHNTPDGATPWTFIISAGYQYQTAGENLAYGFDSSDATITGWMNSPEHRANILNSTYKDVGFGVADSPNYQGSGPETIVVAMYASPQPNAVSSGQQSLSTTPAAKPSAPTPAAPVSTQPAATPAAAPDANVAAVPTPTAQAVGAIKPAVPHTVASKNVARIQLITGGEAPWMSLVLSSFACVCIAIFIIRHGLFWHRKLIRGEQFIVKHHLLDVALVSLSVLGFIFTRSQGVIH